MEFDIIVIGGGPAGLSAAARAAWLSAPQADYRARILLLESSDSLGGLSQWQPLVINTPGVFFTRRERKALVAALSHFGVQTRFETVTSLAPQDDRSLRVVTERAVYRCAACVVATGCRLGQAGESRLFHKRRLLWYHGDEHLDHLLDQLEEDPAIGRLCLCGAEGVVDTLARIGRREALAVRAFAEPPVSRALPAEVSVGRLAGLRLDPADDQLALRFDRADGARETVTCDVLLIDFNAYEATAVTAHFLPPTARRGAGGFLDPGRDMATGVPGLFSAGDVNGAPFCVAKALSDGTVAGFEAYRHAYRQRFAREPDLFPYYAYRHRSRATGRSP